MKKMFLAVFAAMLFSSPVFAGDSQGMGADVRQVFGEYVTFSGTSNEVDFGFVSDYVRVCLEDDSARVWYRTGRSLTTLDGGTGTSPTAAGFKTGSATLGGQALTIFPTGDGTDVHCVTDALNTSGLVFMVDTAEGASLDVSAYKYR